MTAIEKQAQVLIDAMKSAGVDRLVAEFHGADGAGAVARLELWREDPAYYVDETAQEFNRTSEEMTPTRPRVHVGPDGNGFVVDRSSGELIPYDLSVCTRITGVMISADPDAYADDGPVRVAVDALLTARYDWAVVAAGGTLLADATVNRVWVENGYEHEARSAKSPLLVEV